MTESMMFVVLGLTAIVGMAADTQLTLTGDWSVRVVSNGRSATLTIDGPEIVTVTDEKYSRLIAFSPKGPVFARGEKLAGIRAKECSVRFAMDPSSLEVRLEPQGERLTRGKDYEAEMSWGCVGRLDGGAIEANTPVYISYRYGKMRLDSIVLSSEGTIVLRKGQSHVSIPVPPELPANETRLANVWVSANTIKLTEDNLFPVLEARYPEAPVVSPTPAERFIPLTIAKLNAGEKVRILAWGDSVTDATYLPNPATDRWQEQFVARLRKRYPRAQIELLTEAWGGRNTGSYFNEPPGSPHNYTEKVLAVKPDLIVSEFINDSGLNQAGVDQRYGRLRDDFRAIGAEWIILTPHYARPDWMGLTSEKNIDEDPRAYVKALRKFAADNAIALADASLRWGRLWRRGIPYSTLLMNNINHPNPFGMSLFADALMALFPERGPQADDSVGP